jgi:hypothetical protein
MKPLTIRLNDFTSSRHPEFIKLSKIDRSYVGNFWPEYWKEKPTDTLISLYCNDIKVLKLYIDSSMEKQTETVMVPDGASCEIQITNATSSHPQWDNPPTWYVNYTVYHGDFEEIAENPTQILQEFSHTTSISSFERMPGCYFDKLSEHIDRTNVYKANDLSSKAIDWLQRDKSDGSNCKFELFVSRYALSVLNFAAPKLRSGLENELWINYDNQCTWPNIICAGQTDSSLSDFFYLDISSLVLSGYIATEIGLMENLLEYDACKLYQNYIWLTIRHLVFEQTTHPKFCRHFNSEMYYAVVCFKAHNNLTGSIPTEIGMLLHAERIDLCKSIRCGEQSWVKSISSIES